MARSILRFILPIISFSRSAGYFRALTLDVFIFLSFSSAAIFESIFAFTAIAFASGADEPPPDEAAKARENASADATENTAATTRLTFKTEIRTAVPYRRDLA
jgi:hypothetical protein